MGEIPSATGEAVRNPRLSMSGGRHECTAGARHHYYQANHHLQRTATGCLRSDHGLQEARMLSGEKADISREVGGAFKAWGDHISGFNLVLQPGRKIVQAWRAHDWWADHYSIATFELRQVEVGTELRFTQIGVPPHRFDGHSRGWIETYWRPMQDLFEKGSVGDQTRAARAAARQRIDQLTL